MSETYQDWRKRQVARRWIREQREYAKEQAVAEVLSEKEWPRPLPRTELLEPRAFLHTIFAGLNMPQQLVFQTIDAVQKGENPSSAFRDTWAFFMEDEERITFQDILLQGGMSDGKKAWGLGLIGDLTIDPVMFLPWGALSKVGKAARIRLMGTKEGMAALRWFHEVMHEAPGISNVRHYLKRAFSTRPDISPAAARSLENSVMREVKALEEKGLASRSWVAGKEAGQKGLVAAVDIDPKDVAKVEDVAERYKLIENMLNYREHGRMPHQVMSDALYVMKKKSDAARAALADDWMQATGAFFRQNLLKMDPEDVKKTMHFAEESRILDPARRAEMMNRALEGAKDLEAVKNAGGALAEMFDRVIDMGKRHGVDEAILGGGLRAERYRVIRKYAAVMKEVPLDDIKKTAVLLKKQGWGDPMAQRQAAALADIVEMSTNKADMLSDAYDLLWHSPELTGLMGAERTTEFAKLASGVTKDIMRVRKPGYHGHVATTDAWSAWVRGITEPNLKVGKMKALARREADMKKIAESADKMPGYVPHYMGAEDAQRLAMDLSKKPGLLRRLASPHHRSMIERRYLEGGRPLSLSEVEEILTKKESELGELGARTRKRTWGDFTPSWMPGHPKTRIIDDYFGLDPVGALALRGQATARAVGHKLFRDDVTRIFGHIPGGVSLERFGFDSKAKFDPNVANAIRYFQDMYVSPAAAKMIFRIYDECMNVWRGFTLFPFPAYHSRNAVSDIALMAAGGHFYKGMGKPWWQQPFWKMAPDPEAIWDIAWAHKAQVHTATGNVDKLAAMKVITHSGDVINGAQLVAGVKERGGLGIGFFLDNWSKPAEAEAKMAAKLWEGGRVNKAALGNAAKAALDLRTYISSKHMVRNPFIRGGRAVAEHINNVHRLAFIRKRLRIGDSFDEAVAESNKWLLDYSDLTPFETQVLRRQHPFFSWFRLNTPRAIETIVDNPHIPVHIERAIHSMRDPQSPAQPFLSFLNDEGDGIRDPEDEPRWVEIPDWMRRMVPFPLRRNDRGEIEMLVIKNYLPIAEIESIAPRFDQLGKTFLDMLSPIPKLAMETATRRNFFYDKDLYGKVEFMGMTMDARLANALSYIRAFHEFDRMNWLSAYGLTTKYFRPESEQNWKQKLLQVTTGVKVYPLDTRLGHLKNLEPVTRTQRRYNWMALEAIRRQRAKEIDEKLEEEE